MNSRVTFNTTEKAEQSLEDAVQLSGNNKTDCLNKAIQIYTYLLKIEAAGGEVRVRENPNDSLGRLRVF